MVFGQVWRRFAHRTVAWGTAATAWQLCQARASRRTRAFQCRDSIGRRRTDRRQKAKRRAGAGMTHEFTPPAPAQNRPHSGAKVIMQYPSGKPPKDTNRLECESPDSRFGPPEADLRPERIRRKPRTAADTFCLGNFPASSVVELNCFRPGQSSAPLVTTFFAARSYKKTWPTK